jgi:Protein of unknown function (DUF998)
VRIASVVAAAAAATDMVVLALLHVVSPEVDPLTRPVSEYALGSYGWLAAVGTLAEGLGALGLAVALRQKRSAAALLGIFGLAKLMMPLFPVDPLGTPATTTGQVHNVLGNLAFFLFPLAALLLMPMLWRIGSRLAPVIAVVLAVATVGVLVGDALGAFGMTQRVYLVLCSLWLLLTATVLFRS